MFEEAKEVLGYDLLDVCQNGPKSKLDNTVYAQPALFVSSMAAVEKFKQENEKTVSQCSCTAGLSLGEYTALVFADVMSFKDALKVVKVRGESMAQAAAAGDPHGMVSILFYAATTLSLSFCCLSCRVMRLSVAQEKR